LTPVGPRQQALIHRLLITPGIQTPLIRLTYINLAHNINAQVVLNIVWPVLLI
jgi:hypothetical protein